MATRTKGGATCRKEVGDVTTQEEQIASLEGWMARLAQNQLTMAEILTGQETRLRLAEERLEETRRDVQQNRRLWERLAQRFGWIDEDGLFDDPG